LVAAAPTYTPVEEAPQPATPDVVQEPIQSYFIPAEPVSVPAYDIPAVQEDYLLLSQPETTSAPFIPLPVDEPAIVTAAPESFTYSSYSVPEAAQEPVAVPVEVPFTVQQEEAVQVYEAPAPVEEAPQQVAVFFSAPAQQVVAAPAIEYLPPSA
jgi:hypothetical protein